MNIRNKPELRVVLREQRRKISVQQQSLAAQALIESTLELPGWRAARSIALYLPFDGEISTSALARHARDANKTLYLPVIDEQETMHFALWQEHESLQKNRFGIEQPGPSAQRCRANSLDIIFAPVVGWDAKGTRLGMGGGYYDRALANKGATIYVGLAHTCQQVAEIKREEWDIGLDYVATDTALHYC